MADTVRIVRIDAGGRARELLNLEDPTGAISYKVRDSFKITAPVKQQQTTTSPRRYAGSRQVGEKQDNGSITATWMVKGPTAIAAMNNIEAVLAQADATSPGTFIGVKFDGAPYEWFFEIRGTATYEPQYSRLQYSQIKGFPVVVTWPVAPLPRGLPLDVYDDFTRPEWPAIYTNLIRNPSFEVDASLWVPDGTFFGGAGVSIARSTAQSFSGLASGLVTLAGTQGGIRTQLGYLSPGTYAVSVYVRGTTSGDHAWLALTTNSGTQTIQSTHVTLSSSAWTRITLIATVTAIDAEFGLSINCTNAAESAAGSNYYIDAAHVVLSPVVVAYHDGDTYRGRWQGAQGLSISDYIAADPTDDWTFDAGAGTLGGASGQMVPTTTVRKQLYHSVRGYRHADVQVTMKVRAGATIGGSQVGLILKRLGPIDYLIFWNYWVLQKIDNNALTNLQFPSGPAIVGGQTYWMRMRSEGNVITCEVFFKPPGPMATPDVTGTYQLSATEITKWGAGVVGDVGFVMDITAIDWAILDFSIEPFTYRNRTLPDTIDLGVKAPGTAPALADLYITPSGGTDPPIFAAAGWAPKPPPHNLLWNGDFEDDIDGWAVGTPGFALNAGGSIVRDTGASKFGSAAGLVTTTSTNLTGASFPIYRRFRKGVTYTAEAWIRSGASTKNAEILLGSSGTDVAASAAFALSSTFTRRTVTWTAGQDATMAWFIVRMNDGAPAAINFHVDGVMVYEGTTPPTSVNHIEGRGAVAPFGILEAEAVDTTDLVVGTNPIQADASSSAGYMVNPSSGSVSGAGSVPYAWWVDPSLLPADEFDSSVLIDVLWRGFISPGIVSPRLILSAVPEGAQSAAAERYSSDYGAAGHLISPIVGGLYTVARAGVISLPVEQDRPVRWKLKVVTSWAATSSGAFQSDYVFCTLRKSSFMSPTGKTRDTTYPNFVSSVSEQTKIIRSSLRAQNAKPGGRPADDTGGFIGAPIELRQGVRPVFAVKLSSRVPDDSAGDANEQLSHAATVHVAVTPRYRLGRGT